MAAPPDETDILCSEEKSSSPEQQKSVSIFEKLQIKTA